MTPIVHPSGQHEFKCEVMLEELRDKRLPPSFLYDSHDQAKKWLKVHEKCSPIRVDPKCEEIYNWLAKEVAKSVHADQVILIGLGCGDGLKDADIAQSLKQSCQELSYWPVDVSEKLTQEASNNSPANFVMPIVLDLANTDGAGGFLRARISGQTAVVTLFGMLPNIDPLSLALCLKSLICPSDLLLCSANLSPGNNYRSGVASILPQYDNEPTREWLLGALAELGVNQDIGQLMFSIEESESGLLRIVAKFIFEDDCRLTVNGVGIKYEQGDILDVFYSIRHTLAKVREWFEETGMRVISECMTHTGEEAVFLCQKI